jgi:glycerophosphoryl diester phosphodiesterase
LPIVNKPLVVAHRGIATGAAENTIEAFTNAIAAGADMVEFDVRRTRDGELIVFHDSRVGGTVTGDLTRDEIASVKGVRPPLFAEVLGACAGQIRLDVELKEDGYVPEAMTLLRAALDKAGADAAEQVVTSFLPAVVARAKDAFPEVRTGLLVGTDGPFYQLREHYRQLFPAGLARQVRADYLAPHYKLASYGVVARAAAAGLPCLLWTVNDDADITRFARDPRVAAIITDRAARVLALTAR